MPVLDASFLLDCDRGHPPALMLLGALADDARPLLVPAPALMVFLGGTRDAARARAEVEARFEVVEFTAEDAARAAAVARVARGRGSLAWTACATAGVALSRQEALVTGDPRAFENVEGLEVVAYRR